MEKQKDIMANKLVVAPAPHVQTSQSTARIMRDVVIALMPALVVSAVVFGAVSYTHLTLPTTPYV